MKDPIEGLSDMQLLELSGDLQVQLEKGTGTRPMLWILAEARKCAREALIMLVTVNVTDATGITALQNEVRRYDDMVNFCRALINRGKEADRNIGERDRSELQELVMTDDERKLYRLDPQGSD